MFGQKKAIVTPADDIVRPQRLCCIGRILSSVMTLSSFPKVERNISAIVLSSATDKPTTVKKCPSVTVPGMGFPPGIKLDCVAYVDLA